MKRFLPFLIILAVAVCAGAGGFAIYKTKKAELNIPTPAAPPGMTATSGANPPHTRGPKQGGSVVLEEFGDYQCPPCAGVAGVIDKIQHEFGQVTLVFRQFPLAMHQHARKAAAASEAAAAQGKFWEMHKLLYENQAAWSNAADAEPIFEQYAQQIRLDLTRFKTDVASPQTRARIAADESRGKSLGVSATPTLFLNDERVPPPAFSEGELRRAIERAISGAKPIFSANEAKPTG